MRFARARKAELGLDMSPMIDCIFQLLIFFMLSSTFLAPAIPIELPQAAGAEAPKPHGVIISAGTGGKLYLGHEPVVLDQLESRLAALLAGRDDRSVIFRGDEGIAYRTLMAVMDAARRAGATSFLLAHEAPGGSRDGR